ncbi:MAG: hypothetical protein JWR80_5979 [Bradyrhizobium sp.]|nr:hypothetical protein [Bradyrhizobium sp.]
MAIFNRGARLHLLAAVAIGAMAIATPALAQEQPKQEYNLEAQDLGQALVAVSRQSGREINFPSAAVRGKRAPRLRGFFTPDDAVRALLADSGLVADFSDDAVIVRGRDAPSSEVASHSAETPDIVVTGSRIRGGQSASPVIVGTRERIEEQGLTDLGSFARTLPQSFSGGQNPGVAGGGAQGANNNVNASSTLNLRGLGPDATLTLLNGHRVAYDALAQGVDISAVPLAAVERVEIVPDGASALYGSDAVGGVANIILRRDLKGLITTARFGASTDGGNEQQEYSAVGGTLWATGGVMLAGDYSSSTAITARERSYTRTLDNTATLLPSQKQYSFVLAGHQQVSQSLEFALDAQFNSRDARYDNPFFNTSGVTLNGLRANPKVTSYSVTPSLRFALPGHWRLELSGTHGDSRSDLHSRRYLGGAETAIRLIYDNRLDAAEVSAEGPLFGLPAGDVRLATGGGYRSNGLDLDTRTTPSGGATVTTEHFSASRDIFFGYGELSVPIIGRANRMSLVERLTLTGALRYEDNRDIGSVATPKVGIIYEPHPDITIKASWGKSFKAPTLYQQNQARQGVLLPGSIFQNNPSGLPVLYFAGGGTPLKPERATTWTVTLAARPSFVPGLSIEASYFNVQYRGRVAAPITGTLGALGNPNYTSLIIRNPTAQQVNDAIAGLPQGLSNQSGSVFNPGAVAAIIDGSDRNVARQSARGVDVAAVYRTDIGVDHLSLTASASYLESDRQLYPGQPVVALAGTIFDPPHWRGKAGATWERSNISLSTFVNYLGGTTDDRTLVVGHVGSFTSVDAVARVRSTATAGMFKGVEITLSAINLLNEKPDIIPNADPAAPTYDSSNYPAVGRFVSLSLRKAW